MIMNTKNLSRRTALAGLLGATATAAVPVTIATAAAAPEVEVTAIPAVTPTSAPDPIFAMIRKHKKARKNTELEHQRAQELWPSFNEMQPEPPRVVVGEQPEVLWEHVDREDLKGYVRVVTGKTVPIATFHKFEIEKNAPANLSDDQRAKWIRAKTRELTAARRKWDEEQEATPYSRACDKWNTASDKEIAVTAEMIATQPTTIAGLAALLKYWSKIANESDHHIDLWATKDFMRQLAKSAQALG
jgi:hypothetical protein